MLLKYMSNKNPLHDVVNSHFSETIREQISEALEGMSAKEGKKFIQTIMTDCKTHLETLEDASEGDDDDADDDQEMKPSRDNDEEKDDDSFGMHEVEAP